MKIVLLLQSLAPISFCLIEIWIIGARGMVLYLRRPILQRAWQEYRCKGAEHVTAYLPANIPFSLCLELARNKATAVLTVLVKPLKADWKNLEHL